MTRRLYGRALLGAGVSVLLAAGSMQLGSQAHAAGPAGGSCELAGTATFTPGLKATPQAEKYTFSGTVSQCHGTNSAIKSGTVTASGAGTLTCGGGTSSGVATVAWNNGTKSVVKFSTTSAAAATLIKGSVTSGTYSGDSAGGFIVFQTTTPQACASATGLTKLTFTGVIAVG